MTLRENWSLTGRGTILYSHRLSLRCFLGVLEGYFLGSGYVGRKWMGCLVILFSLIILFRG